MDTWGHIDQPARRQRAEPTASSLAAYSRHSRLLPSDAFALELDIEFKRARQSRNAFTLLIVEVIRESEGIRTTADDATVHELSSVISRYVREADLLGKTGDGALALVLVDTDSKDSERVTKRLISKLEDFEFPRPVRLAVGAASFPAQAFDADSLKQHARSRLVVVGR